VAFVKKTGGWFRAGESEVDPFYLGQGLDELEERIAEAVGESGGVGDTTTVGADIDTLDGAFVGSGGHSFVVSGTVAFDAKVVEIRMRLAGDGPGGTGNQYAKGVVYGGAGLGGLPGAALLGVGSEVTLHNPFDSQMVTFAFPSEVIIPAGDFSYGIHLHNATVNQAITIPYQGAAANTTLINNDSYTDGTITPFGTLTGGYSWRPGIQIDLITAPAADLSDAVDELYDRVTTIDAEIVTIDDRLDDLEAATGDTSPPILESQTILDDGEEYQSFPEDLGVDGGVITVSALTDVAGTLTLEESPTGATWVTSTPVAVAADVRSSALQTTRTRYVRRRFLNSGGSDQTTFELISARLG